MVQDPLQPESSQDELMLAQAIKSIREAKFAEAKELLTRLLRTDQNNATYWVWMSASMETQKERLYCLQMAYRMDPENKAARRGLVLMGALNPDENIKPFPMNHPRPWDAKIKLADEKPKPTGLKRVTGNPVFRLALILVMGMAVLGGAVYGLSQFVLNRPAAQNVGVYDTPRPTVTPYVNSNAPTANATVPPLAKLLTGGTYTPTAIYAATPHGDVALDSYRGAMNAYSKGQWDTVVQMMAQVATTQPGSVDAIYFMAEARRLGGQYKDALDFYQQAISINPNFAPIYLGRARTNQALNPKKDVIADLNAAVKLDPLYVDAYVARAQYYMTKGNLASAKADLEQAVSINPNSPAIQLNLARLLLATGENEAALAAAQKAKELDITMLDAYLVLGMAYRANGQVDQAVDTLNIYTQYSPNNSEAFTILGAAYYGRKDYPTALKNINQAIQLDQTSSEAYYWRGEIHMATNDNDLAIADFRQAFHYDTTSFDAGMGISEALLAGQDYNNAYANLLQIEKLADTDQKRAIFLYYRAISLEKLNIQSSAYSSWTELLSLPQDAMTADMRSEAEAHLIALKSATPPPPTLTATETIAPTDTRRPSATPTFTPTPKVSPTPTP